MEKMSPTENDKLRTADLWFLIPVIVFCVALLFFLICFISVMVSDIDIFGSFTTPIQVIESLFGYSKKNELLTFLGLGMGGVLLALQAVIANRRAKAMEHAAEQQARANYNTEQGQRQERLNNAIEHLGHKSVSVRLGGAYELFHLAEDDTYDMRRSIFDILCAHIRDTTSESKYQKIHPSKPSEEIQSLLTLLFVQNHDVFLGHQANLTGAWLNGADLNFARLQRAQLDQAKLQNAALHGAQLQGAWLVKAQLQGAILDTAQLRSAFLNEAEMQVAHLNEAQLQNTQLLKAQLQGADLRGAKLQEARLTSAQLKDACLDGAWLQFARLYEAQLQGASLAGAQLQNAQLYEAQLQGATLGGVNLQGAEILSTQLQGAVSEAYSEGTFKERIEKRVGKNSDLSGVIFAGGLSQADVDSFVEELSGSNAAKLRDLLKPHVDHPISHKLPVNSGVVTKPPYIKADADLWIAEYDRAMSEAPKKNHG